MRSLYALLVSVLLVLSFSSSYAQDEDLDVYDPFVDFSEFEESSEEEADINFFRNGRFFTLGFVGGYRGFTENLANFYDDTFTYGFFLNYFFDLRFAMIIQYTTGNHIINYKSPQGTQVIGDADISTLGLGLKYYFNTQNVTRGVAQLNPYVVGGFSQVTRTTNLTGQVIFSKDTATGLEFGGGIELPLMRNKMFIALQGTYNLVTFRNETAEILLNNGTEPEKTGFYPTGDIFNAFAILGVNF